MPCLCGASAANTAQATEDATGDRFMPLIAADNRCAPTRAAPAIIGHDLPRGTGRAMRMNRHRTKGKDKLTDSLIGCFTEVPAARAALNAHPTAWR